MILLGIIATYGWKIDAFVCEWFIGPWTGGGWDDRVGDVEFVKG